MSSLVGKVTYFSTSDIRQVCVSPFKQGWYRFTAVLGKVFEHDVLHFQTFRGGVRFGTSNFASHGNTIGISSPGKLKKREVAPVKGASLGKHDESAA